MVYTIEVLKYEINLSALRIETLWISFSLFLVLFPKIILDADDLYLNIDVKGLAA